MRYLDAIISLSSLTTMLFQAVIIDFKTVIEITYKATLINYSTVRIIGREGIEIDL